MKVVVVETLHFPQEIIFGFITDIPHHMDWVDEPIELVSLSGIPAKPGAKREQNAEWLGKKLVTLNPCNISEKNRKFGWKSEKLSPAQVKLLLEPIGDITRLSWMIASEEVGIVQLAEPLLIKQANTRIKKSLVSLKAHLQCHVVPPAAQKAFTSSGSLRLGRRFDS